MANSIIVVFYFSALLYAVNGQQCFTPYEEAGECIEFKSCTSLYTLIQKKPLLSEDRQHLSLSQCGYINNGPLVCCPLAEVPDESPKVSNLLPRPGVCGIQTSDKIIGGEVTKIDEFPWTALLEYSRENKPNDFYCGGSLINDLYVLTASHCINGPSVPKTYKLVSVRLGEWNVSSEVDCVNINNERDCSDAPIDVPVKTIITHEKYNPQSKSQQHDIALLRLARKVVFSDYIKPICLPVHNSFKNRDYSLENFEAAGWGRTLYKSKSDVKLKVLLPGVAHAKCNDLYSKNLNVQVSQDQLCAGGVEERDSCKGDSGGPLMGRTKTGKKVYVYLAGVVSYGPRICGMKDWPGVYTKVNAYIDWIESKLLP